MTCYVLPQVIYTACLGELIANLVEMNYNYFFQPKTVK